MSKLFQTSKNSKEESSMSKELVFIQNEQVLTDSRVVAEYFRKEHKVVLEAIRNLIKTIDSTAQKSAIPSNYYFMESSYVYEQNGRELPMYLMNRDGFTMRGVA